MPREIAHPVGVEVDENRLAGWVRNQRRREERGVMPGWQRELLGQVPGFSWNPLGEQWDGTCVDLALFLSTHKRMPRYRSADSFERALAAWVHKQRHLHRLGVLPADRVEALGRLSFRIL